MIDFLLSHLYIIVIIAFAVFTGISSRSGKNKSRNSRPGMPTFGGGADVPGKRTFTPAQTTEEREQEAQRRYHEAQRQFDQEQQDRTMGEGPRNTTSMEGSYGNEGPYTSTSTSEGSRMEPMMNMGRAADRYQDEMQERLDRMNEGRSMLRQDRIDFSASESSSPYHSNSSSSSSSELRLDPEQAAQGVIWAEILSPPRSRHAGGFGRKAAQQPSKEA